MDFTPYRKIHSVDLVGCVITMADEITLPVFSDLQKKLTHDLGFTHCKFDNQEKNSFSEVFELQTKKGEAVWRISVSPEMISAYCSEYTRWIATWSTMKSFLAILLKCINDLNVATVGLGYIDKFVATKKPVVVSDLFNKETSLLPRHYFKSLPMHYMHNFSEYNEKRRDHEFIQIEIINSFTNNNDSFQVSIDCYQGVALNEPKPGSYLYDDDLRVTSAIMELLHLKNKSILKELLSSEACEAIGLSIANEDR